MLIALIARDAADSLQIRMDTRPAHLDYLKSTEAVIHAGPLVGDDEKPCGSLIVLDMDMAAAQAWAEADPYAKAGLFASVELVRWNKVIG
jgi:uncharacterized protein YciI